MFRHGPSCLSGPVTRARGWWTDTVTPRHSQKPSALDEPAPDPRAAARPIRTELVERVRREIAEGIYETPEKLEIALQRLLRRLEDG